MAQGGGSPAHHDPVGFGGQFGYYTDPETGLLCLTHRYYDPGTGKFINRDPIGYAGGQNLYGFADGNPVNEIDPSGDRPLNAQDILRFGKLRSAANSGNSDLSKEAGPLVDGAIVVLKQQIAAVKGSPTNDPTNLRALWSAIDHLGDTEYGTASTSVKGSGFSGLHVGASKCNIFVADSYGRVIGYGSDYGIPLYGYWWARHPASANYMGDASRYIEHFPVTTNPLPGDVACFEELGRGEGQGPGHVTLVVGNGVLIYAGGKGVKLGSLAAVQREGHYPVVYRHYERLY